MAISSFYRILLVIISLWVSITSFASIIGQESLKTHLRWNLSVPKDQVYIVKRGQILFIETVNLDLFDGLVTEIKKLNTDRQYIDTVDSSKDGYPAKPATIEIKLINSSIELFTFYRDADKKYILDFWINKDLLPTKTDSFSRPLPLPVPKIEKSPKNTTVSKPKVEVDKLYPSKQLLPIINATSLIKEESNTQTEFRDFRYGASFVWNYRPLMPTLEKDINLSSKIPDALYPIKDRVNIDDAKEAHVQLSINFYREAKWGLMNKSINLYEKKYGRDKNFEINEFLKANALLKDNITKSNRAITQSAVAILNNIKDLTKDYDFKSSVLRYLIQYSVDNQDYIKSLEYAKELYVEAQGQFDHDLVIKSALYIINSLAELRQLDKLESFLLENPKLNKLLPPQVALAYVSFTLLSKGEIKELVKRYELVEKSLTKPVHPAILFNVGEAYFRLANYELASERFDEFLANYAFLLFAPHARLRLALSYELQDKSINENLVLYKNAIDRSTSPEIRYEAKLRYVGMKLARKISPDEKDKDTEIFLEQSPDETKAIDENLKKLLWLVRLRLLIATKKYDEALAYLTSIPLDTIKPLERKVFESDGAEIIYGMIHTAYLNENYTKAVKIWEIYKNKYESKVAKNPYLNFVICDSFLKLGLYQSFDRSLIELKKALAEEERNFPVWVERTKKSSLSQMIEELEFNRMVAEKKWSELDAKLASSPVSLRDSLNYSFYQGLVFFSAKNYVEAAKEFEKVLINHNNKNKLTPRQTADLLMTYVESLYQLQDQDRFKTVVKAVSEDIGNSKSAPILNIAERINYLLIEAYAGEVKPLWQEIEVMTKNFREKFQKSPYTSRINYLFGLSLIKNSKVPEGREVFKDLTNDENVPMHIKEMCRSELATLELKEKNI